MLLEITKWIRSRRFFIILLIFCLSGLISPMLAYYSDFIIKSLSNNSIEKIILPKPTWESVMISYFKNMEQSILFIVVFFVSKVCTIEKCESLQLFYATRANKAGIIYNPKLISSICIVVIGIIIGDICALYMEWVFFGSNVEYTHVVILLAIHLLVFIMFILLGVATSIRISSPFLASCLVESMIMLSKLLVNTKFYNNWLPISLLNPQKYLDGNISLEQCWKSTLVIVIVTIICVLMIQTKPIRKK